MIIVQTSITTEYWHDCKQYFREEIEVLQFENKKEFLAWYEQRKIQEGVASLQKKGYPDEEILNIFIVRKKLNESDIIYNEKRVNSEIETTLNEQEKIKTRKETEKEEEKRRKKQEKEQQEREKYEHLKLKYG